jgi:hypothetical protein
MEVHAMKNKKHSLQVFIKPVDGYKGNYFAFFQSEFLQSTFFLGFKDNIMGAIALNSFVEMLGKKYDSHVELCLSEEKALFHNQALLDIVTQKILLSQLRKHD